MYGAVRTYNAARVVVIFAGQELSGFADGTFVAITQVADGMTTEVGADGEIARAVNTDRRCTVTITLQQTSASNLYLSRFFDRDALSCGGRTAPLLIQDLCGDTMFSAANCWVVRLPDIEFAKEIMTRAWTLQTGVPAIHEVGGNPWH